MRPETLRDRDIEEGNLALIKARTQAGTARPQRRVEAEVW